MAQTKQGAIIIAAKRRGMSVKDFLQKTKTHKWCNMGRHWQPRYLFVCDNSRSDNLSYKCTECTKSKNPYASLKGRVSTFKGRTHTPETKAFMSNRMKGAESPMKGKRHSIEARKKISEMLRLRGARGERCHSYKDGKIQERRGLRFSKEYKRWRYDVFVRDKFTCVKCGYDKGGNLNAHHIKSFSDYPELRFIVANGVTLCKKCHDEEHYG